MAARWRDGHWSARANTESGIPEFDRLALAFDRMAAEVSARDQSLNAITKCAAGLVTAGRIAEEMPRILQTMGEAILADRILVLEAQTLGPPKLRYAWHGPAATLEVRPEFFGSLPRETPPHIAEWLKPLRQGGIVAVTRSDVANSTKELFDEFGIASNLQVPILVDGTMFGQLSIDDCHAERAWSATETYVVRVLADFIGAGIARERHIDKLSQANEVVLSSPAIVYRFSADVAPPHLTYVSDNVSAFATNPAELIAKPESYLTLIHPDDQAAVTAALAETSVDGGSGSMEFRIADASGTYRWMESRYTPLRDANGRVCEVVGVLTDVTERKAAEEKLQFANSLLMTLRDTSPDAILVVDADQRIISFNRQFAEMWHLPPDLIEAGNDAPVLAAVASSVKDPDVFVARVEYLYQHPEDAAQDEVETADGRFLDRHTDVLRTAEGRYLGRVWFFRDVTERKLSEAKITQMARYDFLTGLANRGLFVENAPEHDRQGAPQVAKPSRSSISISIISRTSTTRSATRSATFCFRKSRNGSAPRS